MSEPIRPLFPFYGSKWRDAKRYPTPTDDYVVEPFAGSAGYSLWHAPKRVHLIDVDPIVVAVWRYLISVEPDEILELADLEPGQSVDTLDISQAAKWLIGFWLNRGSAQPKKTQTAFSARTERQQLVWSERARVRIARDVERVRHWTIELASFDTAPRDEDALYFVDPPYIDKGRFYRYHDVDHQAVGKWARDLPGSVIVCEQANAHWLPFEPLADIKSTRGRSVEVVWKSKPS